MTIPLKMSSAPRLADDTTAIPDLGKRRELCKCLWVTRVLHGKSVLLAQVLVSIKCGSLGVETVELPNKFCVLSE